VVEVKVRLPPNEFPGSVPEDRPNDPLLLVELLPNEPEEERPEDEGLELRPNDPLPEDRPKLDPPDDRPNPPPNERPPPPKDPPRR